MALDEVISESREGLLLAVDVRPGARETRIVSLREGRRALRVDVRARPERGAANRELVEFLSRRLGKEVTVVRGATSRHKAVLIRGGVREQVLAALGEGVR